MLRQWHNDDLGVFGYVDAEFFLLATACTIGLNRWWYMVPPEGLEPATYRVETCCSIQLSYGGTETILRATTPARTIWFTAKTT